MLIVLLIASHGKLLCFL
jgi:patatin-like phospholipase/acyl hydrolase